jgi:hypothetical protein
MIYNTMPIKNQLLHWLLFRKSPVVKSVAFRQCKFIVYNFILKKAMGESLKD